MTPSDPGARAPDALARAGRVKRWLRPFLRVFALAFVLVAAKDLWARWGESRVELDPVLAVVACLPLFAASIAQGFAWIFLIERMAHRRVAKGPALSLYLVSQLARYTPGKVGLPLVRMEGAPKLALVPALVGVSVLVEMLSWTATGSAVGFGLLAFTADVDGLGGVLGRVAVPALAGSVAGLALLLVLDRARYPKKLRALVAPGGEGPVVPVELPLVQLLYWGLVAAHGYLMSLALGANGSAAVIAMGLYVVASVAGFVVLAAPAGLGVREAVLLAGLGPLVGSASALGAALVSRAASLVTEVLAWLLVRAFFGTPSAPRSAA